MLTGVAVFLVLLIGLLAIPVSVTFQVSWPRAFQDNIELKWAFGLVSLGFPSDRSQAPSTQEEILEQRLEHVGSSSRKNHNILPLIRQKVFRRRIIKFVCDLWHAFHKRDIICRLRIGLGDPADTGLLWSFIGPVAGILANFKDASFEFEPEFIDTTFELDSSGSIRFIPLQIIYLIIGMLLSPSVWQGLNLMRKAE